MTSIGGGGGGKRRRLVHFVYCPGVGGVLLFSFILWFLFKSATISTDDHFWIDLYDVFSLFLPVVLLRTSDESLADPG